MTGIVPTRKTGSSSRRHGYVLAVLINGAMLYVVTVWPGWQSVPVLTEDTHLLLGALNLALIAGMIVNVVNLILDLAPVRALGDLIILGLAGSGQADRAPVPVPRRLPPATPRVQRHRRHTCGLARSHPDGAVASG